MEERNIHQARKSSALRLLKPFLSRMRTLVPLNKNSILPYLQVVFSYLQKTQYPVDDLKSDIEELFSLCFEHMEIISSKSHEEFGRRAHAIRSNTMKEIVAQFQATDRLNDLPQELMNNILARVILERVSEKITACIDNLPSREI
ncbi:hypothetical protein AAC387_Pa07g3676 [Persea americana]